MTYFVYLQIKSRANPPTMKHFRNQCQCTLTYRLTDLLHLEFLLGFIFKHLDKWNSEII
jgi:hypothetical protein